MCGPWHVLECNSRHARLLGSRRRRNSIQTTLGLLYNFLRLITSLLTLAVASSTVASSVFPVTLLGICHLRTPARYFVVLYSSYTQTSCP